MPKNKRTAAPAAAPLQAQGRGRKRTPQSAFDGAAGKDTYEPEKIIGQRIAKGGVTQFLVKWVGWETKHNTWEPLVTGAPSLASCEDMIADFKDREKQRQAEMDMVAEQKQREKQEAAQKV